MVKRLATTRDPNGHLSDEVIGCLASMLGEVGRPFHCDGMPEDAQKQVATRVDERLRTGYGVTLEHLTEPNTMRIR